METRTVTRLDADDVEDIRKQLDEGVKPNEIKKQYGIGLSQISQIKWRKRWAHVA